MASGKNITEITILNLLNQRPMYGAEMVEEIKKLSGNTIIMSLPTLYSCLHRMATKKLVNSYQKQSTIGGRCRVYNITKIGREYLNKNQIKIDYSALINNEPINNINTQIAAPAIENESSAIAMSANNLSATNATVSTPQFTTLNDAFSLPLNKSVTAEEITTNQNNDNITSYSQQTTVPETRLTASTTNESLLVENPTPLPKKKTKPDILPYISPNEKITTTPEPQYQQTLIGLSGTTGGNDLRPLVELNEVSVGNDYVIINRLRIASALLNTAIFMLINFFCSLFHSSQNEYYKLIYIVLILYACINLAIFIVYPRIKSYFNSKACASHHAIITIVLLALVITCCLITSSWNLMWLAIFSFLPLCEFIIMSALRKRSCFQC